MIHQICQHSDLVTLRSTSQTLGYGCRRIICLCLGQLQPREAQKINVQDDRATFGNSRPVRKSKLYLLHRKIRPSSAESSLESRPPQLEKRAPTLMHASLFPGLELTSSSSSSSSSSSPVTDDIITTDLSSSRHQLTGKVFSAVGLGDSEPFTQ
ncbi:hypothetical protein P175DRAFT_0527852 [Aspergillus ochraceoroseus IBT 24754]|uniref:Uncharacterized protein n=1 Tax=Aspergillus ochraceoroseus IBT 24754 TaxID=1392256 RepID=A0A2T5M767_9EURO|nr:uncharacterized protein P175DRAFT_0527852 [Aspergillus ochraceoroseus IBT 24754]PTU24381.1 hypothetical protein P175DRAFT_0527852 [Aspergillus ochraceoroseus IBT 24754]